MTPLDPKKRYLQVALNSTLDEAYRIIHQLPVSDRIIIEAGTPLIKRYGEEGNGGRGHPPQPRLDARLQSR